MFDPLLDLIESVIKGLCAIKWSRKKKEPTNVLEMPKVGQVFEHALVPSYTYLVIGRANETGPDAPIVVYVSRGGTVHANRLETFKKLLVPSNKPFEFHDYVTISSVMVKGVQIPIFSSKGQ